MTVPTPDQVLAALRAAGLRLRLEPGWDDPGNAAPGSWEPAYVLMHHTGNGGAPGDAPSLRALTHTAWAPIRGAHFLVARSGLVHVVYTQGAYHAGAGGPGAWAGGPFIPADTMNRRAYGIEIESAGLSLDTTARGGTDGLKAAQLDAAARLAAALLQLLGAPAARAINHRTWAPGRKIDTQLDDSLWHQLVARAMGSGDAMALSKDDATTVWAHPVREFVDEDGNGERDVRSVLDILAATHRAALQAQRQTARLQAVEPPALQVPALDVDALVERVAAAVVDRLAERLGD